MIEEESDFVICSHYPEFKDCRLVHCDNIVEVTRYTPSNPTKDDPLGGFGWLNLRCWKCKNIWIIEVD